MSDSDRRCQKILKLWTVFTGGRVTKRVKRRWVRNTEGLCSRETKCTGKRERGLEARILGPLSEII